MHRSSTVYKQKQFITVLNRYVGWTFSLEKVLWIMDSYFGQEH